MSDWENEDFEPIIGNNQDRWDDEEEVKASWDDDEDEEEKQSTKKSTANSTKQNSPPAKKKKTLAMKIAEREEAERKKREQEMKKLRAAGLDPNETPEERKKREQNQILESDLQNAKDLFGDMSVKDKKPTGIVDEVFGEDPSTKDEFDDLGKRVAAKLLDHQKSIHYTLLVETLIRELCAPLSLDDARKISTIVNAQINEKQKAFSNKKKKGGATKKASLRVGADTIDHDLYVGEYDDFM